MTRRCILAAIAAIAAGAMLGAAGCSPALDWREFAPEGAGITVAFPCRPDHHSRSVPVAGAAVRMDMLVCPAGGVTYALAYFDVTDPAGVPAALTDLRAIAAANVGGGAGEVKPLRVPGMTPGDQSARLRLTGRRPDGGALQEQAAFFAKGLRVYQASVIGRELSDEAVDTFFGSLKLPS